MDAKYEGNEKSYCHIFLRRSDMRLEIKHQLVAFREKGSEKMIKQIWIASESNMDLYDLIGIVIDNLGITIEQIINLDYARENDRKEIRLEYEVNK